MTTESFTPHSPDVIDGTGPYAVPFAYSRTADLVVNIRTQAGALIVLPSADWSVSPATSDEGGDVTLSTSAAALYDGDSLTVTRATLIEQGWASSGTAREDGLEVQLDRLARATQDQEQLGLRAIRMPADYQQDAPVFPLPALGKAPVWGPDGTLINGPDAGDIAAAQTNAAAAAASAAAAAASADEAATFEPANFQPINALLTKVSAQGEVQRDDIAEDAAVPNLSGHAGKFLRVNAGETGTEFSSFRGVIPQANVAGGSTFEISGIPSGTSSIQLLIDSLSLSGTDNIFLRLGTASGIAVSGYGADGQRLEGTGISPFGSTNVGFPIVVNLAVFSVSGIVNLERLIGTNRWYCSYNLFQTNGRMFIGGGVINLSGELDRIGGAASGANTFDNGLVAIKYQ